LYGEIRAKSLRDVASAAFFGSTPRATSVRTRRVELMLSSRDDALLFASPLTTPAQARILATRRMTTDAHRPSQFQEPK
jgi:hypothetical protein